MKNCSSVYIPYNVVVKIKYFTNVNRPFTPITWLGRDSPSILSELLENTEHHPRVMGCDTLTTKDIRSSNIL